MKSFALEPLNHNANLESEWNESYYFVFYNRKLDLGGMTRLGFKPNKSEGNTFLILFLPDGSAALYQSAEKVPDDVRKANMRVGSMAHKRSFEGRWNYRFKGTMITAMNPEDFLKKRKQPGLVEEIPNVELNLDFTPINDIYEYSENMTPESRELGRKSGDEHWEQIGKTKGIVQIGKEIFAINDTIGQRDHTYGIRDWTGIGNWLYYVVWFSEDLCVNPAAIIAEDGRISSGGFIFKNGKNIPIINIRVVSQEFRNDVFPVSSEIEIIDATARRHVLKGRTKSIVPIPFTDAQGRLAILAQALGEFELDNRKGGSGSFETLRKA